MSVCVLLTKTETNANQKGKTQVPVYLKAWNIFQSNGKCDTGAFAKKVMWFILQFN